MATILLRFRYSEAAFKGLVDNPTNRREAVRGVLAEMGWDLVEAYFSTTRGGGVL